MEEKPLQLIAKPTLTLRPAQQDLYKLICQKLKENKPIEYDEAKKIYFEKGCKNMINGWPHFSYSFWVEEEKRWQHKDIPFTEENVRCTVFTWLTFNIGRLVMKGALKIIPQIELT